MSTATASRFTKAAREYVAAYKRLMPSFRQDLADVLQKHKRFVLHRLEYGVRDSFLYPPGELDSEIAAVGQKHIRDAMAYGVFLESRRNAVSKAIAASAIQIPFEMQLRISDAVDRQFSQQYWKDKFTDNTRRWLSNIVFRSIQEGWTTDELARFLQKDPAGIFDASRALATAKTEINAGINGGIWLERSDMIARGLVHGAEWLAIFRNTRRDHANAHAQQVRIWNGRWVVLQGGDVIALGREFVLGNERAAYPGDPTLSVGNRVNCQCTTISVIEK